MKTLIPKQAAHRAITSPLLHHSPISRGPYKGQMMQTVPAAYLLRIAAQPWGQDENQEYTRIAEYVDKHRDAIERRATREGQA